MTKNMKIGLGIAGAGIIGYALFMKKKDETVFGVVGKAVGNTVETVTDAFKGFANWFGGDGGNQTVRPNTQTATSVRTTTEAPVKNTAFA